MPLHVASEASDLHENPLGEHRTALIATDNRTVAADSALLAPSNYVSYTN